MLGTIQMRFVEPPPFSYISSPSTPLPSKGGAAPRIRMSATAFETYTPMTAFNLKPAA